MTPPAGREPDRRRHARIQPKGTATIHALGNSHPARILDIGLGGTCLATAVRLPERLLGRTVDVELRFDGALAAWQRTTGRVARITADSVAIVFDGPTVPALLRVIDELTTASHASSRVLSVVLIDGDAERRGIIATGFRAAGCHVIEVGSHLEAIVRLGEAHFEPDIIALAGSEAPVAADEMRGFIERAHPSSMLITIGSDLLEPTGLANWLSAATKAADLPGRIRALLFAPRLPIVLPEITPRTE